MSSNENFRRRLLLNLCGSPGSEEPNGNGIGHVIDTAKCEATSMESNVVQRGRSQSRASAKLAENFQTTDTHQRNQRTRSSSRLLLVSLKSLLAEWGNSVDLNFKSNSGMTPLHLARDAEVTKLLLKYGANASITCESMGNTPLLHFLSSQDPDFSIIYALIESIQSQEPRISIARKSKGSSHSSSSRQALSPANTPNKLGITPLHYIISRLKDLEGKESTEPLRANLKRSFELLLKQPSCDVHQLDNDHKTPLLRACEDQNKWAIKLLVDHGAHIDLPAAAAATASPLQVLLHAGDIHSSLLLIEKGVSLEDSGSDSIFHLICSLGSHTFFTSAVGQALRNRSVRQLFSTLNSSRETLLFAVCRSTSGSLEEREAILSELLTSGAIDVNAVNGEGLSAFHVALQYSQPSLATLMIEYGATGRPVSSLIPATNQLKLPSLHFACRQGWQQLVIALATNPTVDPQISFSLRDSTSSRTPIAYACVGGHRDLISTLITSRLIGVDDEIDDIGNTLLHYACICIDIQLTANLVLAGANMEKSNHVDVKPLEYFGALTNQNILAKLQVHLEMVKSVGRQLRGESLSLSQVLVNSLAVVGTENTVTTTLIRNGSPVPTSHVDTNTNKIPSPLSDELSHATNDIINQLHTEVPSPAVDLDRELLTPQSSIPEAGKTPTDIVAMSSGNDSSHCDGSPSSQQPPSNNGHDEALAVLSRDPSFFRYIANDEDILLARSKNNLRSVAI